jgi:hypothetical protein
MATFEKRDGYLRISLDDDGRAALAELNDDELDSDGAFLDLIERQLCNGWQLVAPEEIGALTDAPIISDDVGRDDQGKLTAVGSVYAWMNYQILSPARELRDRGHIDLEMA